MKFLLSLVLFFTVAQQAHAVKVCETYKFENMYMNSKGMVHGGNNEADVRKAMSSCFFTGKPTIMYNFQNQGCKCVTYSGVDEAALAEQIATKIAQKMQERNDADFNRHREETFKLHSHLVNELGKFLDRFSDLVVNLKN